MKNVQVSKDTKLEKLLVVNIGGHYFGAPIGNIQDVIQRNPYTPVPLASKNIIGVMNLRGHIVTEIDVAYTLGLDKEINISDKEGYSIVVTRDQEMYSFVFQEVGDVIDVPVSAIEKLPDTVDKSWTDVTAGVYRYGEKLIVLLDFDHIINHIVANDR